MHHQRRPFSLMGSVCPIFNQSSLRRHGSVVDVSPSPGQSPKVNPKIDQKAERVHGTINGNDR
jgi:hypothetical protein